jgi:protein-disulfide isomerase
MLDLNKLYSQPVYIKKWYRRWWVKLLLLAILSLIIFVIWAAFYVLGEVKRINQQNLDYNSQNQAETFAKIIEGPYYDPTATTSKVTIIEFSDFACPFCKASYPIFKVLLNKYPDQIDFIYRDHLLHDQSMALAMAGRCAAEQSKFWKMHDWLFDNQDDLLKLSAENLANSLLLGANKVGLDETAFNVCLSTQKYGAYIAQEYKDATQLHKKDSTAPIGTPTTFIKVPGNVGYIQIDGQFTEADAVNLELIIANLKK